MRVRFVWRGERDGRKLAEEREEGTDFIPLPHAIVFLEESLIVWHAVFAVHES